MRLLPHALALALASIPIPAPGQGVPDYSNTPRAQVPEACKARFTDIYASPEAWRQELEAAKAALAHLETLAKGWTASPGKMADLLQWRDGMVMRIQRLYAYASLQSDMDMGDSAFQAMKGQAEDLMTQFDARLAFMEPDVLALGQAQVEAALAAEPRLAPYRVGLLRTLRRQEHIAAPGEERVAALTQAFTDAPAKASAILNDVDQPRAYYGHDQGVVRVDDWIRCEWSVVPHFYMNFYVFQYATSMAASMALAQAVLEEGEPARERYLRLLRSGGSQFPVEALRSAGVDFSTPRPVQAALAEFDRLVGEMETIHDRMVRSPSAE
jgi:oligoendopeptidase F